MSCHCVTVLFCCCCCCSFTIKLFPPATSRAPLLPPPLPPLAVSFSSSPSALPRAGKIGGRFSLVRMVAEGDDSVSCLTDLMRLRSCTTDKMCQNTVHNSILSELRRVMTVKSTRNRIMSVWHAKKLEVTHQKLVLLKKNNN